MSSTNSVSHQDITAAGLSEADQNINNTPEDISHKAAGHKANLSNPSMCFRAKRFVNAELTWFTDTSEESKKRSEQALKELGGEEAFYGKQGKGE